MAEGEGSMLISKDVKSALAYTDNTHWAMPKPVDNP